MHVRYDILPKHLGTGGNPDFNYVREGVVLLGFQDKIYNTTISLMNSLYAPSFHASVGPRSHRGHFIVLMKYTILLHNSCNGSTVGPFCEHQRTPHSHFIFSFPFRVKWGKKKGELRSRLDKCHGLRLRRTTPTPPSPPTPHVQAA